MARLKSADIRKLTPPERQKKLQELYNELTNARIELATGGGTQNPHKIKGVRKAIARVLTIEHEIELEGSK
ncbi:MAG: 50S ribosomal protein L29 [Candidatus Thorarchaeota archaeon]|nr:MAG: 50S ribosomal protein L29 [Candidatus Thorarchaeota archaeon]